LPLRLHAGRPRALQAGHRLRPLHLHLVASAVVPVSASRRKGTAWESRIVAFLCDHGFSFADRVPMSGAKDRGDVTIGPASPVIEAKNVKQSEWATALDEANAEASNAHAPFGVVWAHRRGKGSPGDGYVVMDGHTFVKLLHEAGYAWEPPLPGRAA
jgi:hypothetical protein